MIGWLRKIVGRFRVGLGNTENVSSDSAPADVIANIEATAAPREPNDAEVERQWVVHLPDGEVLTVHRGTKLGWKSVVWKIAGVSGSHLILRAVRLTDKERKRRQKRELLVAQKKKER